VGGFSVISMSHQMAHVLPCRSLFHLHCVKKYWSSYMLVWVVDTWGWTKPLLASERGFTGRVSLMMSETAWCSNCSTCAGRKTPAPKPRAPLSSIVTGFPLQLVAADIIGPFPETTVGNCYILVAADYFTRWVEAYPIPNQEAPTVA
jgi:hypothetical protein